VSAPAPLTEALQRLLLDLPATFPPESIDRVWLFAPRERAGRETGLVVLSLRETDAGDEDARRLVTWRYEAVREKKALRRTDALTEQGRAPADRIPRLIDGVLARLGDEAENPVAESIGGDPARWDVFLQGLGLVTVDRTYQE
jgi:hypothetical protein